MRLRWPTLGLGLIASLWLWQRRRRSDLDDLDQRLAGQIQRLGDRESELEAQVALLRKQETELAEHVERLGEQERELEVQVRGIGEREERLQREISLLRERESELESTLESQTKRLKKLQLSDANGPSAHWSMVVPVRNFNVLVHTAQLQLSGIQIHDQALRDSKRLNGAKEKNWLPDTWKALGSLHEYATTEHGYRGDYEGWTESGISEHAWYLNRIAMHESEATMGRHGETRVFPVDTRVDPSGRIAMEAHLKIALKGSVCPRVFFHDDTEGETGLVHIGFIGPHDLVPVASYK